MERLGKDYEKAVEEQFIERNKHKPILCIQRLKCPECKKIFTNLFRYDYLWCPYCDHSFAVRKKHKMKYKRVRNLDYKN